MKYSGSARLTFHAKYEDEIRSKFEEVFCDCDLVRDKVGNFYRDQYVSSAWIGWREYSYTLWLAETGGLS